ncbi:MAG: hypothetical protein KF819_26205 [Labilithrix sp.]|nr:hypothetical protein [Labilithrix sp.]
MRDIVVVAAVVIAFATLVTAHVAIAFGLLFKPPRWRAIVAFAVAPAAPWFAFRERMRVRAWIWIAAAVAYVVARVVASF